MHPTEEQEAVVASVLAGHHAIVTALPGSGKSSVAYELIRRCVHDQQMVLVMYNRDLCESTNAHIQRIPLAGDRTARAFTFHGILSSIARSPCHTDLQMAQIAAEGVTQEEPWDLRGFTVLIIDECQDMRPLFFEVIRILVEQVATQLVKLRIVLLGDPNQLLYDFFRHGRADARFLTLGDRLLRAVNCRPWDTHVLTQSFRSTAAVASFVNAVRPGHSMRPGRVETGRAVQLYTCDIYADPARYILGLLSGRSPGDVMVLCASLNKRSPARCIVGLLSSHGIPVHVARSGRLGDNCSSSLSQRGKVRFKTFCAAKGLESKVVVVLNTGTLVGDGMTNSAYVAITRSSEHLVIFQDSGAITAADVGRLSDRVPCDALSVITLRPCSTTTRPGSQSSCGTVLHADSMFAYTCPRRLSGLISYVCTMAREGAFEDSDGLLDTLDIECPDGLFVNVTNIVVTALRLALEYRRTGSLPRHLHRLETSSNPRVARLYDQAMRAIADNATLRPFAMLATAADATHGFCDKIHHLHDFSFVDSGSIWNRLWRMESQADAAVPVHSTRFSTRRSVRPTDDVKIVSRPTLCGDAAVFCLTQNPTIDDTELLGLLVHMAVHERPDGVITSVLSGASVRVHVARAYHQQFVADVVQSVTSSEQPLPDAEFIDRFRLRTPTPTAPASTPVDCPPR